MSVKLEKSEQDHIEDARARLLAAALGHVVFDGWSDQTFQAALAESGVDPGLARLACPRKALDLALASHRQGDAAMLARFQAEDLGGLRYSEKVATLVRFRLEAMPDKEVVRRSVAFFALPQHAGEGAGAIWNTSDLIWKALGDTSDDLNWYSKRAILSAVYSSSVLFWLGDNSDDHQETRAFIDRRIANVMQFEKAKARFGKNPVFEKFLEGPGRFLSRIKAPDGLVNPDLPGYHQPKT